MRRFDVFNGDADGICALHQLRLAEPAEAEPVTGLKHEIALLGRVDAGAGDEVTVLDVSLDRNRAALLRLLDRGARVRWFDHHYAGDIPEHPNLDATIDDRGLACTSELVDRHLGGRFRAWAVVAAFGDNLHEAAARLASPLGLAADALARLRSLGESLNYNGYGASLDDVVVAPGELYAIVARHADPLKLLDAEPLLARLEAERLADLERALATAPAASHGGSEVFVLPDARWSRRVMGVFANRRALDEPRRAHAVLAPLPGRGFAVSVRVPLGYATDAAGFCRGYPGGGGRTTAAGIECLPAEGIEAFIEDFARAYRA